MRRWVLRLLPALVVALVLWVLVGEDDGGLPDAVAPDPATGVELDTPALRAVKREAGMADCPRVTGRRSELPDVTLACLGGGPSVSLPALAGPAVVPVWAQWCGPCREELPWFEALHRRAGDRLAVIGVNWQDLQPEGALRFAAEAGVTFPSVADPDAALSEVRGLPVLYLVDREGAVTVKRGALDGLGELVDLVERHTGVVVPPR